MRSQILAVDDPTALTVASEVFAAGGLLIYPTETLYGIGGDPRIPGVSRRIHGVKRTPESKPHLILTDEWSRVASWLIAPSVLHQSLMRAGSDLELTILFDASDNAPRHLVGGTGLIGVRRTTSSFCRLLVGSLQCPVISTSANRTGHAPPRSFDELDPDIIGEVDVSFEGPAGSGAPSTIVTVQNGEIVFVRVGAVSRERLLSQVEQTR